MKKFVEVVTELQEHSYKGEGGDALWRNGQPAGSNRVMANVGWLEIERARVT